MKILTKCWIARHLYCMYIIYVAQYIWANVMWLSLSVCERRALPNDKRRKRMHKKSIWFSIHTDTYQSWEQNSNIWSTMFNSCDFFLWFFIEWRIFPCISMSRRKRRYAEALVPHNAQYTMDKMTNGLLFNVTYLNIDACGRNWPSAFSIIQSIVMAHLIKSIHRRSFVR